MTGGRAGGPLILVRIRAAGTVVEVRTEAGARLDDVILSSGLLLDRPCGGRGTCGKCRVAVAGRLSAADEVERLAPGGLVPGARLACRARVEGEVEVVLPGHAVFTDKTFSSGTDLAGVAGEFGLALDLGTTTVGALIAGLEDGKVYAGHAGLNLQASAGSEVMGRLEAEERRPGSLRDLGWQSLVESCRGLGLEAAVRARVRRAVVVGNSAMHHLALSLPVATLLRSPFEPCRLGESSVGAGPLAELFPNLGEVIFPELLGGFVGSDALACVVYFGLGRGEPTLALDLGTNGEVLLSGGEEIWAASTAAGPAFEGVNISAGMRASPGAVTRVDWTGSGLTLTTVDDVPARGLAGSGLLSAVRTLVGLGVIEASGRIVDESAAAGVLVLRSDGVKRVVLAEGLALTQLDVRELQKAKAAVRAAVEILLERAGLRADDLERVVLTGGFGSRLDPADALGLGVLPELGAGRLHSIANGAGLGAARMLDPEGRDEAAAAARRVRHVELNLDPSFLDRYVRYMTLSPDGETRRRSKE